MGRGCLEDWSWRLPGICGRSLNHRCDVTFAAQKRWPRSWTTREMTSLKSGPRRQGKLCDKSTSSVLVDGSWASNSTIITICLCVIYVYCTHLYSCIDIIWYLFRIIAPFGHSGYWQLQCFMIRCSGSQSTRGRLLLWWGQGRCCTPKNNTTVAIPSSCRITQDFDLQNFFHGLDKDQSQAQRSHYLQWFDSILWAV